MLKLIVGKVARDRKSFQNFEKYVLKEYETVLDLGIFSEIMYCICNYISNYAFSAHF